MSATVGCVTTPPLAIGTIGVMLGAGAVWVPRGRYGAGTGDGSGGGVICVVGPPAMPGGVGSLRLGYALSTALYTWVKPSGPNRWIWASRPCRLGVPS